MKIRELQDAILSLKKEKDVCILAHSYQASEIAEIADFTGDSYQLSVKAKDTPQKNILMCGVRFMAETVKILSPEKHVYLSNPIAGCPMAEQMDVDLIEAVKAKYPDHTVVAYINTTADLKCICDVCVTSSSAVKIVKQLPNSKILCQPNICDRADYIGSTSGIIAYAKQSDATSFIIGTEISIAETLQYACPDKQFYPLTKKLVCQNMKATTLMDVYHFLQGTAGEEICMEAEKIQAARQCIDQMIALGG